MTTTIKKPKPKWPLVEVLWDDASGLRHGWEDKVEKLDPMIVMSVGFLIFENEDHIIIAMDVDDEGQHNGRSQIPKGMIKSVRTLRKASNDKSKQSKEIHEIPSVSN